MLAVCPDPRAGKSGVIFSEGVGGGVQFSALTAAIIVSMELYFRATRGESEHGIFFFFFLLLPFGLRSACLGHKSGNRGRVNRVGIRQWAFFFF